jgi:hypothetical protein
MPYYTVIEKCDAVLAQLVEHDLAKVGVTSSSLVYRSKCFGGMAEWPCSGLQIHPPRFDSGFRLHYRICPGGEIGRHKGFKIPRLMVVTVQVRLRAPIL